MDVITYHFPSCDAALTNLCLSKIGPWNQNSLNIILYGLIDDTMVLV